MTARKHRFESSIAPSEWRRIYREVRAWADFADKMGYDLWSLLHGLQLSYFEDDNNRPSWIAEDDAPHTLNGKAAHISWPRTEEGSVFTRKGWLRCLVGSYERGNMGTHRYYTRYEYLFYVDAEGQVVRVLLVGYREAS